MKSVRLLPRSFAGLILLAVAALLPSQANANLYFNTASGNWDNPDNWDEKTYSGPPDFTTGYQNANAVPDANTSATIREGRTANLSGSGSAFIVKVGAYDDTYAPTSGTLNITGGNLLVYDSEINYGGAITVSGGSLFSSDPSTPHNSSLHVYDGALTITGPGLVQIGFNSVGSLYMEPSSGTATLNIGTGGTAGTLNAARILGNSSSVVNFNHTGSVTFDTLLTGNLSVTKSGSGTTSLTGSNVFSYNTVGIPDITENNYTGGTTINAGSLRADGGFSGANSSLGTGAVTVNDGGTLSGNDYITGLTTIKDGGHLALGGSDVLRFDGGLILEDGASLDFSLGGPTGFIVIGDGVFTAGGTITVNLSDAGGFAENTPYILISFDDADSFANTAQFQLGTQIDGFTTVLSFDGNSLVATATVGAVPEPGTYAAFAGLGALVFAITRRRR